jgi:hypothetical protein
VREFFVLLLVILAIACAVLVTIINIKNDRIKALEGEVRTIRAEYDDLRNEAVRRHYAEYNKRTGEWQWSRFLIVGDDDED